MKRVYRVYKKTVSIVNETAIGIYENLVGKEKGFLLESYDKNYDRFTFSEHCRRKSSHRGDSH